MAVLTVVAAAVAFMSAAPVSAAQMQQRSSGVTPFAEKNSAWDIVWQGVGDIADSINRQNGRGDFVRALGDTISARVGHMANVLVVDDYERYTANLTAVNVDRVVEYGKGAPYHVFVFQSGTFSLHDDGGWNHWGMWGRFNRSGDAGRDVAFDPPAGSGPSHGTVASLQSANGTVADLDGALPSSGTKIKAWEPHPSQAQQWVFWDKGNGNWQIETQYRGAMVLDYNFSNWTTWLFGAHDGNNQLWRFNSVGNGWYTITSARDGACLTADKVGDALGVWRCDGTPGQRWHLVAPL
ncbi:RICIN domain-containing protein [Streptomyces melanogenes]|uniref:RICIN domain-containing protein n=1 Tax=Streptomyces melanogenes TaxID=67326 RepID=A0ABZ1XUI2_9ACTN|nr:RICIN domain-containing protein [Streptomyces melanogenes]